MPVPNIGDVLATTIENRSGETADNITNNIALLNVLQRKGNVRPWNGGHKILEEIMHGSNPNSGWYEGYELLPVGPSNMLDAAEFTPKQYSVAVTISGREELMNNGKEQVIDLMERRIKASRAQMKNDLEASIFSNGTGDSGKEITGLDAAIPRDPTLGTYGGINRAVHAFWRPYVNIVAITAGNVIGEMTEVYMGTTRGNDVVDLIVAGGAIYGALLAATAPNQRFTDPDLAKVGFQNIMFMGAAVVNGGGIGSVMTATDAYFLNTNYIFLRPHAQRNMVALKRRDSFNQDASVVHLVWAGNLTSSAPRQQGRIVAPLV